MSSPAANKLKPSALNHSQIMALLLGEGVQNVVVLKETTSTNSYLLKAPIERQCAHVCIAEAQTAGRGRHGTKWLSAANRNIMLSLSWGFHGWPQDIGALSLAVGLAITKMLNESYGINASIKWPNDILVDNAKLAGILIDVAGHPGSDCQVVVGVGLNVDQVDWDNNAEYAWCDLKQLGVAVERNELAAQLIKAMVLVLRAFEDYGFASMVDAWNSLSAFSGRQVSVSQAGICLEGLMLGVENDGALLIEDERGKRHRINDSRASLRLVN